MATMIMRTIIIVVGADDARIVRRGVPMFGGRVILTSAYLKYAKARKRHLRPSIETGPSSHPLLPSNDRRDQRVLKKGKPPGDI